jgi:uncharacterized membrane protein required for colicin V production
MSCVGQVNYNLTKYNCEHFANLCRYGKLISRQVKKMNPINALTDFIINVTIILHHLNNTLKKMLWLCYGGALGLTVGMCYGGALGLTVGSIFGLMFSGFVGLHPEGTMVGAAITGAVAGTFVGMAVGIALVPASVPVVETSSTTYIKQALKNAPLIQIPEG